jgi:serine/threonine-protein kinase HipA
VVGDLTIWLNGVPVATVEQVRRAPRLTYRAEALSQYELGVPLLSVSLPLVSEPYPQGIVSAFLGGLLPEGEPRRILARAFGVREEDTFGLIAALGRDCAGALVIQPTDEPSPRRPRTTAAEPVSDAELAELVGNLRSAPLGAGGRVRVSLGGVQEKVLLTRMPDSRWGRPIDGTPSTHILKPEIAAYPHAVENEAFCMRLAKHLDLAVAEVETAVIGTRKVLIVRRYDRVVHADGSVDRLHQEDFCQATATRPSQKYEEDGGPSLRRIADLVHAVAARGSVEDLLRAVTLNVLIANGDAHAKNFSLLHVRPGELRLAPLYDLISTLRYGDDRLAMRIDDVQGTERVAADRIVNEAGRWGVARPRAATIVADLLARVEPAIAAARDETEGLPSDLPNLVNSQLTRLRTTLEA